METTYTGIRTGVMNYVISKLSWASASNTFDYRPDDIAVVLNELPAVLVDFHPEMSVEWDEVPDQGHLKGIPLLIEIFVEVEKDDTSHGRDASEEIATKLKDMEGVFVQNPSIGGLVKLSTLRTSKIENVELQAVKLAGVTARWAWLVLVVFVVE